MSTVVTTIVFTFHHVSIKTTEESEHKTVFNNSHSTMYLLKPTEAKVATSSDAIHIPPCIY